MSTIDFGGGDLTSAGSYDIYLAQFTPGGAHQWSKRFGDGSVQTGKTVAVDGMGNVFLAGHIMGSADFGGDALTSAGSYDVIVAKFDASGAHQWSKRFGDSDYQYATSVDAKGFGDVFLTGYFAGTVNFGGGDLFSAGASDAFIVKFSDAGDHQWSQRFGDAHNEIGYGVATRPGGGANMTGVFENTIRFGGSTLTSAGQNDVFLAIFDAMAYEPVITSITDIGNDQGRKVKIRFNRTGFDEYYSPTPIVR
jgi:hypothetical protein